ncbi:MULTISPECIES: OmpA family protein [unclassified Endozoicomonas]|uniref:OmpA family protein n=1 Tax=unclassified Endozoicomonas TaxID=2644528 RepID=UPI002148AB73|nr:MULTISPECIES: OmpA family protein [unclassified Endozoicomonas]
MLFSDDLRRFRKLLIFGLAIFGFSLLLLSRSSANSVREFPQELTLHKWELTTSRFQCRLNSNVTGLGSIVLNAAAGGVHYITLEPDFFIKEARHIRVAVQQSPWRHSHYLNALGGVEAEPDKQFEMRINVARVVEDLQQGHQLVVEIQREAVNPVHIKIPAMNFQKTAATFYQCYGELLALNYEQAKETLLYYPSSRSHISPEQLSHLDDLATYILVDKSITNVAIDAHTDSRGDRLENLQLSKVRASRVYRYLRSKGISEQRLTMRFHGDRYPVATNTTVAGRNKNRRVKITLSRR